MSDRPYPRHPLYVVSKGRSELMITSKHLTEMGVRHYVVAEPAEAEKYRRAVEYHDLAADVLELDLAFKERYETCDDLGLSKSTGPGPARNFAWADSVARGAAWHWVMDDNLYGFFRLNHNLKTPCRSPAFFRAMEDFCSRYENVGMAGPNYFMFASRKTVMPPFTTNTRIYSCNLVRNDAAARWRGRYNEDTILSLDLLSDGWVTVLFNAFLILKQGTQLLKGGCTADFYWAEGRREEGKRYAENGTVAKSEMLAAVYPEIAKVVEKFGRVHHQVDYSGFKQKLAPRPEWYRIPAGKDDYGMRLVVDGETAG